LPHLIEIVAGLDGRGIGFRSLTENIDTTTAGGRLTFHIFGALAHYAGSGMMQSQAFHSASIAG
jgi:DNA invertase Pin-like site-specific DNA recombinase